MGSLWESFNEDYERYEKACALLGIKPREMFHDNYHEHSTELRKKYGAVSNLELIGIAERKKNKRK